MSKVATALQKAEEERDAQLASTSQDQHVLWEEVRRVESSLASWKARTTVTPPAVPASNATAKMIPQELLTQAIDRCQAELLNCEQLAAAHVRTHMSLQAQVTAQEQFIAKTEEQLKTLRGHVSRLANETQSIETNKQACLARLTSLRECQVLAHKVRMAEAELHTTQYIVDDLTQELEQMQRQLTEAIARAEQRSQ